MAAKEEKQSKKTETAEEKERARNYHVAKRADGKWQVKFAGGEKAIKLFDTQAEAKSSPSIRTEAFPSIKKTENCANKNIESKKKTKKEPTSASFLYFSNV